MPVTLVRTTAASKLGPISVTYRAGGEHLFSTCPSSCKLNPFPEHGATQIDVEYMQAVLRSVPRKGHAWTYSHFPAKDLPRPDGGTVFNYSADSIEDAVAAARAGIPATVTVSAADQNWPRREQGVRFVHCPAEAHKHVTCASCGGGRPLCARGERDYVVVFTGHGAKKRLVGSGQQGGCYAATGNVRRIWNRIHQEPDFGELRLADDVIADLMPKWAKLLPPGALLRHHVAGDIGLYSDISVISSARRVIPIKVA